MQLEKIAPGENPPYDINVVIEIPGGAAGGAPVKYEIERFSGLDQTVAGAFSPAGSASYRSIAAISRRCASALLPQPVTLAHLPSSSAF